MTCAQCKLWGLKVPWCFSFQSKQKDLMSILIRFNGSEQTGNESWCFFLFRFTAQIVQSALIKVDIRSEGYPLIWIKEALSIKVSTWYKYSLLELMVHSQSTKQPWPWSVFSHLNAKLMLEWPLNWRQNWYEPRKKSCSLEEWVLKSKWAAGRGLFEKNGDCLENRSFLHQVN